MQNWQFWNAKSAVLERKTHRFGKQSALSKVLESELFAYYQALIIQPNRKPIPLLLPFRETRRRLLQRADTALMEKEGAYCHLQTIGNQCVQRNFRSDALF